MSTITLKKVKASHLLIESIEGDLKKILMKIYDQYKEVKSGGMNTIINMLLKI